MTGRTLVTGAGGFIGSHLTAALAARGARVRALDVHAHGVAHLAGEDGVEVVEGDVADESTLAKALDGVDGVYHLAAAHLGASVPESEFRRVNVDAVRALLRLAAERGVGRIVHCSSVGVYGRIDEPPADETTPCRPDLPYERTKLEGERAVTEAARAGRVDAVVLRPAWVYGPGCGRTAKLMRSIGRGRFVIAGDGSGWRHCVYVRDMIAAFEAAAARQGVSGETFVIGDARPVRIAELVEEIARQTDGPSPRRVPMPLFAAGAVLAEAAFGLVRREPPVSRRTLRFFTGNTAFDVSRARERLGFSARYDLAAGLAETRRLLDERRPWRVLVSDYAAG